MDQAERVKWERVNPGWWSSPVGYARLEDGDTWSGYVYRNTRTGKAWTERRPGFSSALAAKRWVEKQAEDE
ncbi:MAG TPA: hypothetical protein VLH09_00565 [Bryobacteraceae bacterium]|nr:hypothetical protein [Bryobacteraceae bacterium]